MVALGGYCARQNKSEENEHHMILLYMSKNKATNQHNKFKQSHRKQTGGCQRGVGGTNRTGETQASSNKIHESRQMKCTHREFSPQDGNNFVWSQSCCGGHFIMYKNIKSPRCIPEIHHSCNM